MGGVAPRDHFDEAGGWCRPEAQERICRLSQSAHNAAGRRACLPHFAQSRNRFVDKVPYVTAPGARVSTVVSDLGVFAKREPHGELVLTGVLGDGPERPLVEAARQRCGWELTVAPSLRRFEPPTADELRLIRMLDPRRYFLGPAAS